MMRTGNPALRADTFVMPRAGGAAMTINGTVHRTAILLTVALVPAVWVWRMFFTAPDLATGAQAVTPFIWIGLIGGLVAALVTIFKKTAAPISAPVYAAFEGLMLGGISAFFEARFPGIVMQAVVLTFGTLFALLGAYRSGMIKATENFKLGIVAATGGIFIVYMASMVMGMFGVDIPYIHESGVIGIGFSLVVVVIAALNLVLDFDFIEQGEAQGAPKYMEWYAAFGLLVTLVWLYLEMLRLLSKLQSRN
jgi:uncharacterized YccA/Bax inhibitor family protein